MREINSFDDVRNYLNNLENISYGGCGISALSMARWLKKNKPNANVGFILMYSGHTDGFIINSKYIDNNEGMPTSCSHAGLVVNLYDGNDIGIIDCDVNINILEYKNTHTFKEEEILIKAINYGNWNPEFNRRNIQKIAKALDINLDDVNIKICGR